VPVPVITARRNVDGLTGVAEILFKPFDGADLLTAIARTMAAS
jgi:hypothetical protein